MTNTQDIVLKIGLEIHIQIESKSKLFSSASTKWDSVPNSQVDALDYGLPGALPILNKECLMQALKASLILNGKISKVCTFDRKHYLYPDSPLGYQITQDRYPIMTVGSITLSNNKIIRIKQMHIESDAGKLLHTKDSSLIDFNRTGIALLEIVSEPDITCPEEAAEYVNSIRLLFSKGQISGCNMEEGKMRVDVNVSIKYGDHVSTRCEIKNLNSIRNIRHAIIAERDRQMQEFINNIPHKSYTLRFDFASGNTVVMREKESNLDYMYFPEYDLPSFNISNELIEQAQMEIGVSPLDTIKKYIDLGLNRVQAENLVEDEKLENYFHTVIQLDPSIEMKELSNWVFGPATAICSKNNINIYESKITPENIVKIINLTKNKKITYNSGKLLLEKIMEEEKPIEELIEKYNLKLVIDENLIYDIINKVMDSNATLVEKYKNGEEKAFSSLMGSCMKLAVGKVDAPMLSQYLRKELSK